MTDTLSTTTTPVDTNRLVPKDSDEDPIVWDNNRATIDGVLHEAAKFWTKRSRRTAAAHSLSSVALRWADATMRKDQASTSASFASAAPRSKK